MTSGPSSVEGDRVVSPTSAAVNVIVGGGGEGD